jgi:peptide/nickel transport system permease protein
VSLLIFACLYIAPGSPEQAIVGPQDATPAVLAQVRHEYGLDKPFLTQYADWMKGVAQLDFGRSFQSGEQVATGIVDRLGVTLPLGLAGFLLAATMGIGGGIAAARRRGRLSDRGLVSASVFAASTPAYATGVLMLYVFGLWLGWFPLLGAGSGVSDRAYHLVLPVIALALVGAAPILRITRVAMVDALERDDVAFARARGVPRREVLWRYAFRHASVLIVTVCSTTLISMLVATAVIEQTFNLHGVGSYLIDSIGSKDIPVVQGLAIAATVLVVGINFVTDVLYALIDPRIQHGYSAE